MRDLNFLLFSSKVFYNKFVVVFQRSPSKSYTWEWILKLLLTIGEFIISLVQDMLNSKKDSLMYELI